MKRCHVAKPCANCPFLRVGGIRLHPQRVREIHDKGGAFPCHKTVNHDQRDRSKERECAGAIIFAYKPDGPGAGQMLRISERLGVIDPSLASEHPEVFDSLDEMLASSLDTRTRGARR